MEKNYFFFFFWPGNTNASILKHEQQVASTLLCLLQQSHLMRFLLLFPIARSLTVVWGALQYSSLLAAARQTTGIIPLKYTQRGKVQPMQVGRTKGWSRELTEPCLTTSRVCSRNTPLICQLMLSTSITWNWQLKAVPWLSPAWPATYTITGSGVLVRVGGWWLGGGLVFVHVT